MRDQFNWDASVFFEKLTSTNRLAQTEGFRFCRVASLDNFGQALESMQSTTAFVCVSETAVGYTELNNTPHTRRVKTVFLAMRHPIGDMLARQQCMDTMQELFRQFATALILEKTRLQENHIYLDSRIRFEEIDEYFFSGCACCHFEIAVDVQTDLRYDQNEWN